MVEKGEYCCVSVATVVRRTHHSVTYVHRLISVSLGRVNEAAFSEDVA